MYSMKNPHTFPFLKGLALLVDADQLKSDNHENGLFLGLFWQDSSEENDENQIISECTMKTCEKKRNSEEKLDESQENSQASWKMQVIQSRVSKSPEENEETHSFIAKTRMYNFRKKMKLAFLDFQSFSVSLFDSRVWVIFDRNPIKSGLLPNHSVIFQQSDSQFRLQVRRWRKKHR